MNDMKIRKYNDILYSKIINMYINNEDILSYLKNEINHLTSIITELTDEILLYKLILLYKYYTSILEKRYYKLIEDKDNSNE